MGGGQPSRAVRIVWAAVVAMSVLAVAGCTQSDADAAKPGSPAAPATSPAPAKPPAKPLEATVAPADLAKDVVTATDIVVRTNGAISELALTDAAGKPVAGAFTADGGVWRPAAQLAYGAAYAVKVVAATEGGEPKTLTSTFTTMGQPSKINGGSLYFADGDTIGVGMPLVVEFTRSVPEAARAAIETRLEVKTEPKVDGSWYWFGGSEAHYRPEKYWKPGTKISLRAGIGGLPMGDGTYGKRDRVASVTVGREVIAKVNNAAHTMQVFQDGQLLRTMPVSLGKKSTPTSSGVHVVMEKKDTLVMDSSSYGVPVDSPEGYRTKVYNAVRYTWGGEFTHGAPWSVGDQGRRNVSHGCINLSPANAQWYTDLVIKGDVIEIVGTEAKVKPQDGWTAWNIPWEEYLKGSALR